MKKKEFKKNDEVFAILNNGSKFEIRPETVFRVEKDKHEGNDRIFMYSNSSSCYLSKDVFHTILAAEQEKKRREK